MADQQETLETIIKEKLTVLQLQEIYTILGENPKPKRDKTKRITLIHSKPSHHTWH
jgi:hypothetical protein